MPYHRWTPLLAASLVVACAPADERAAPPNVAGSVLEVVIEDSSLVGTVAEGAILSGMCLRGDPMRGEPWIVDNIADSISSLSLEQLHSLDSRDSSRLAARLARTADGIPGDTLVADFRGLPIVIRDAWLLVPADGDTTYIAIAARRLPMESSPLEEQMTLLATPESRPGIRDALGTAWFARSAGAEDSLETRDPVLAFTSPDGALRLLMLRESALGPRAELLVRVEGRWRRQWMGALELCP